MVVGGDLDPVQPRLAVPDVRVRLRERRPAVAERLDLGARQHQARLDPLEQLIVVPRAAVVGDPSSRPSVPRSESSVEGRTRVIPDSARSRRRATSRHERTHHTHSKHQAPRAQFIRQAGRRRRRRPRSLLRPQPGRLPPRLRRPDAARRRRDPRLPRRRARDARGRAASSRSPHASSRSGASGRFPLVGLGLVAVALAVLLSRGDLWPAAGAGWVLILIAGLIDPLDEPGEPSARRRLAIVLGGLASLLAIAIVTAIVAAFAWFDVSLSDGVGDHTYKPATAAAVQPSYKSASATCGSTSRTLPATAPVHINAQGRDRRAEGRRSRNATVTVNAKAKVGDVERPAAPRRRSRRGDPHGHGERPRDRRDGRRRPDRRRARGVTSIGVAPAPAERGRPRHRGRLRRARVGASRRRDARPPRLRTARARRRRRDPPLPRALGVLRRTPPDRRDRPRRRRRRGAPRRTRNVRDGADRRDADPRRRGSRCRPRRLAPARRLAAHRGIALTTAGRGRPARPPRHVRIVRRPGRDRRRAHARLGPWLWQLAAERAERIRLAERAAVAARVHDSVLQTLALVQRHADDPGRVAARRTPAGARAAPLAVRQRRRGRDHARGRPRRRRRRRRGALPRRGSSSRPPATCRSTPRSSSSCSPRGRRWRTPPSSPAPTRSPSTPRPTPSGSAVFVRDRGSGLRPRDRPRRPARHRRLDRGPHAPRGRHGDDQLAAGRRAPRSS